MKKESFRSAFSNYLENEFERDSSHLMGRVLVRTG